MKVKAFSIIESILAIFITGVLYTGLIYYIKISNYNYSLNLTKAKAIYIRKALEGYVVRYGFLPNAANDFEGEESIFTEGYVPYKALGISKYYLVDGFGNPFKFIVNENLSIQKQSKSGKIFLPIFFNLKYFYNNSICWCRLYEKKKVSSINRITEGYDVNNLEYDKIDSSCDIRLKGVKLKPIVILSEKGEVVNDMVAWVLISSKSKESFTYNLTEKNKVIFWQSRFDLASQVKYPCTRIKVKKANHENIKKKNKRLAGMFF